jgi:PAS domain S-box-containing protein
MNREKLQLLAEQRCRQALKSWPTGALPQHVLQELQVQQIELEMQNDALRQAQATLEQSHERFVDLYELAPVGYLTLTRTERVAEANLAAARMLGLERRALINRRFTSFVAETDRDRWLREFFKANSQTEELHLPLMLIRMDQQLFQVHVSCCSVHVNTAVPSLRVVLTDISGIKQAEDDLLRDHTARLSAIFNEAPDGILIFDVETGQVMDGNPMVCLMLGYERSDLLTLNITSLHPPSEMAKLRARLKPAAPGPAKAPVELCLTRQDGSQFQASVSLSRLDLQGRACVMGFVRNITESQNNLPALARRRDQLPFLATDHSTGIVVAK